MSPLPNAFPKEPHIPVMLEEVLSYLSPVGTEIYVDGTYGAGGYTQAFLEKAPQCQVIAFDRDEEAIERGRQMAEKYPGRLHLHHARFSQILEKLAGQKVNGLVLDLGVSSPQLDQAERGFSFQKEGPLDMRMGLNEQSAADVVNTYEEEDLASLFYQYGEERFSRRIARFLVQQREKEPFTRTLQLASAVERAIPVRRHEQKIHPATRVFQALRIYVNQELKEIETVLEASQEALLPGGRLVVVSFHSLEDRLVKLFLKEVSGQGHSVSRHRPELLSKKSVTFDILTKRAVGACEEEARQNPRARSAKLRAGRRVTVLRQEGKERT